MPGPGSFTDWIVSKPRVEACRAEEEMEHLVRCQDWSVGLPDSQTWREVPHLAAQHSHPSAVRRKTLHMSLGTLVKFPGGKSPGGVQGSAFLKLPLMLPVRSPHGRDTVSTKNHELRIRKTGFGDS